MVIAAIIGYLLGSIPTAVLVGKRKGFDPRSVGDGNPGWWNMRTAAGDNAAWLVFIGDFLKGTISTLIITNLWGPWWWAYVAAAFAIIGHAFPAFANFRGGKGVLTFMGAMLVIAPIPVFITFAAGILLALATRNFAYGARLMVFAVPVAQAFVQPIQHVAVTGVLMTFIGLRFLASYRPGLAIGEPDAPSPA